MDGKTIYTMTLKPIAGICKCPAIWANEQGSSGTHVVAYVRKPRGADQAEFDRFMKRVNVYIEPE